MLHLVQVLAALSAFPERKAGPPGWVKGAKSSPDDILKFRVALPHDERVWEAVYSAGFDLLQSDDLQRLSKFLRNRAESSAEQLP